jgi:anti-sigma factor RsiW
MSLPHETMIDLMQYADGELEADGRVRVEELVRTNDEARRILDAMGALGDVVREGAEARAEAAGIDEIAEEVIAKIERAETTFRGKQIVVPIADARASRERAGRGRGLGIAAVIVALAAGVFLVMRNEATPTPSPVADTATHEPSPVLQPVSPSPSATQDPSAMPGAVAAADDDGVDLEEVSSTKNKVNVFFMPSGNAAAASVVVWIDDRRAGGGK